MSIVNTISNTNHIEIHNYSIKIIIVGDSNVGKSNILSQFTNHKFLENHDITIGLEFGVKKLSHNNSVYKIQLWDTAGQEVFKSLTRNYYRNSNACIFVYDITDRKSFLNIDEWKNEVKDNCNNDNLIMILVGNKSDNKNRVISYDEGNDYAKENNMFFLESSAKTGENINEIFYNIIDNYSDDNKNDNNSIVLNQNKKYYCF